MVLRYPIIDAKKISAHVVRDVDLSVNPYDIVGIVGKNGSGKTTLLRMLSGFLNIEHGNILYGNESILNKSPSWMAQHRGCVFDTDKSHIQHTLGEAMDVLCNDANDAKHAVELMSCFELRSRAGYLLKELSGGEFQRFLIAASMLKKPQRLFLDEPTTGLDFEQSEKLVDILNTYVSSHHACVVLSSHDFVFLNAVCTRVVWVDGGKVVCDDAPKNKDGWSPSHFAQVHR